MLPISIKHPDGVIYHFCSASNFGSCNGHRLIFSKLNTSAASAFINKFKNSELLRIRRLLTKDQLKHLPLRKSIGNALSGAKLQVYEDRQVTKADVGELAKVRQEIKFILSQVLNEEKLETQRIEQQHQKRNVIEKVLIYKQEFDKGLSDAAVSLLTWVKEVADVVSPTENLKRVLDAAWETYNSNSKNWQQTFADQLKAANYKELIEALGFDPSKLSKDQVVELFETAKLIWDDKDTQEILLDFIKQYAAAQHSTEWANMAGSAAFDVILTALLAIFTGGVGVAASLGSKARLLGPLKRLGEKFIGLAKLLKKFKKPAVKRKKTKVDGGKKGKQTANNSKNGNKSNSEDKKIKSKKKEISDIEVEGIKAQRIREGDNDKVAVIGRSMGNDTEKGVRNYSNGLRKEGYDVEVFDGDEISPEASAEFESLASAAKTDHELGLRDSKYLTDAELKDTKLFKENEAWAQKLKDDGYTVVDIGNPNNKGESAFYELEKGVLF